MCHHIFLGMYTKTIFGCSDTDILFYLLFWLGRTSGFCSHQKNKACQEKRQKKCQRSHMKRRAYLVMQQHSTTKE